MGGRWSCGHDHDNYVLLTSIVHQHEHMFGCGSCVEWVVLYRLANTLMGYAEALTALGIDLRSPEVQSLQEPVQPSEIVSDWDTHKEKSDNCVAAAATSDGAAWEDTVEGCGIVGSMHHVVFLKVDGSSPTAWLVFEQVPTRINPSELGVDPCDTVRKGSKQPAGTWECTGR